MELIKEIKSALEVHGQTKGSGRITDVELYASMWLKSLVFKVEEMQKALEWYADPKNYRHVESAAYSDVALDEGETARDALKGDTQ